MKKVVVLFVMAVLVCGAVFASDDYFNCSNLIDKKLNDQTVSLIQKYSVNLTDVERMALYESNKSSSGLPFALNFFLGCGIGSFVQGDTTTGAICLADELVCGLLYLSSYANAVLAETEADFNKYASQMLIFGAGMIAGRVYECIAPFFYTKKYNQRLSKAIYGGPKVAILPTINENGEAVLAMTARIPLN